jgi:hypothetical protein
MSELEQTQKGVPIPEGAVIGGSHQAPAVRKLNHHTLTEVLQTELGDAWRFSDKDFAQETQTQLLEAVLGCKPTTGSVQSLLAELFTKDSRGLRLGRMFPLITKFAENYLRQHGATPITDEINAKEYAEVLKWKEGLDVEMRNAV